MKEEATPGVDYCDSMVGEPSSAGLDSAVWFVDLAGAVTVGVTSPADLAGGVTVGVTAPAVAGVASLAVAGVASLADVGVASLADAGVTSLAVAGVASLAVVGVASLVDFAEVVPLADVAGDVAIGVTFLADPVGVVTEKMMVRDGRGTLDGSVCDCGDC